MRRILELCISLVLIVFIIQPVFAQEININDDIRVDCIGYTEERQEKFIKKRDRLLNNEEPVTLALAITAGVAGVIGAALGGTTIVAGSNIDRNADIAINVLSITAAVVAGATGLSSGLVTSSYERDITRISNTLQACQNVPAVDAPTN